MSYLPRALESLLLKGGYAQVANPGLVLDKYSYSDAQEKQREPLGRVLQAAENARKDTADPGLHAALKRRALVLEALRAKEARLRLRTPLALHLSRAIALENASLSLHRTSGFPVIPGTGLKGLARAYAEARGAAPTLVEQVFGSQGYAGAVVFHDAWPTSWPTLAIDIANNHHEAYYAGKGAPGDWENPVPITFLVVQRGAEFSFAVSARAGADEAAAQQGLDWLTGALSEMGAGAKTAAGYGFFEQAGGAPAAEVAFDLRFVTPAFLAGAAQSPEDATLRAPSIKGLLRWWWRTLHVGALSPADLRALEGHIFGDTRVGQARFDVVVSKARETVERQWTTNGPGDALNYIAYGMSAVAGRNPRPARAWVAPGSTYTVELRFRSPVARTAHRKDQVAFDLTAAEVRGQVLSAAALLCRFGGIGAKSRKGFGSVEMPQALAEWTVDRAKKEAASLRERLRLAGHSAPVGALSLSSLAGTSLQETPIEVQARDWKSAMTRVGEAFRTATKALEKADREALGLPRATRGARWRSTHAGRHAAPVLVSVKPGRGGGFLVSVLPFVASELPDAASSKRVLGAWCAQFEKTLRAAPTQAPRRPPPAQRASGPGGRPPGGPGRGSQRAEPPRPPVSSLPKAGELISVTLVRNEKKQRWDAEFSFADKARRGLLKNSDQVPPDTKPGAQVRVKLAKSAPASPGDLWELEWVSQ